MVARRGGAWAEGLLVAATFVYAWRVVEPSLRYHAVRPDFFLEVDFLRRYAGRPGGMLTGLADLAAQLDFSPILGAAVFALLAGLIAGSIRSRFPAGGPAWAVLPWVPPLILMILYGRYAARVLDLAAGALLALGALAAWGACNPRATWMRLTIFWGLAGGVFWVGGLFPLLWFVAVGGGIEVIARRTWFTAAGCWLAAAWLGLGMMWWPEVNLARAWAPWDPGPTLALAVGFYAVLAAVWMVQTVRSRARDPRGEGSKAPRGRGIGDRGPGWIWLGYCAAAGAILSLTFDSPRKTLLRIERDGSARRWAGVLGAASGLDQYPASARLQVHRALYHTGRLGEALFAFPQSRGQELLPSMDAGLEVCPALSDTLLELGHVNLAERYAHEALEVQGQRPDVLLRLARVNLLKDRPRAARVFLNRLAKIPFQQIEARRLLRAIDADDTGSADPVIASIRGVRVGTRLAEIRFQTPMLLEAALRSSRDDRMAFEYWIAHLLLSGDVEGVAASLARFKELDYAELPRHVEEAVLGFREASGDWPPDLAGWRLRPETGERFRRFQHELRRHGGAKAPIDPALAGEFGDTFWFYEQFGYSQPTRRR